MVKSPFAIYVSINCDNVRVHLCGGCVVLKEGDGVGGEGAMGGEEMFKEYNLH